ncbi:MAG TPA: serine hydrolase domain-containing protein [Gaiella sp.]|nr:serine hydrolase domain-containing protein [Gaiella sp.]
MSTDTQTVSQRIERPRRWLAWALAGLLAVGLAAVAAQRTLDRGDARTDRPELQRVLDGVVRGSERIAPGATAYVSGPNGTWLGSAGVADLRSGERIDPDARMRLESVSKIYTAALVVALAQQGRLRLGDSVERWLPGLLPYGDRITVRQLLTMRSGMIDNNDIARRPAFYLAHVEDTSLRARLASLVRRVTADPTREVSPTWWIRWAAWEPLLFEPGTDVHYSNIGYEVLGLVAARAASASLPELYRREIFEPLGLHETAYDPQGPIAGPHARGYLLGGDGPVDATDAHAAIGAEGGIVSNAAETGAFLAALMQGKLLDPSQVAGMRGPDLWSGGQPTGCAGAAFGWSGGGNGYKTNVWVDRSGTRVAVLLLNARYGGDEQAYADERAASALGRLYCAA